MFHPVVAPYRIDFFNRLYIEYKTKVCLFQSNLKSQTFDYSKIENQLLFEPFYLLDKWRIGIFSINKGIVSQIRNFNPDIILVSEANLSAFIVLLYKYITFNKNLKIVSIVDDSYEMAVLNKQFSKKHVWGERLLFPFLNNLICVEPRVSDYFNTKYGKGLYFPIISNDQYQRRKLSQALPISSNYARHYNLIGKRILLFVGRLMPVKNISSAISAFIKAEVEDSVFIIVGGGTLKEELLQQTKNVQNVILAGRFEQLELLAWYNLASVFILPSVKEPFGAVTNEALLAGCLSLISNVAGSQCLIEDNRNGFLIDPNDLESMSSTIRKALLQQPKLKEIKLRESLMLSTFEESLKPLLSALSS